MNSDFACENEVCESSSVELRPRCAKYAGCVMTNRKSRVGKFERNDDRHKPGCSFEELLASLRSGSETARWKFVVYVSEHVILICTRMLKRFDIPTCDVEPQDLCEDVLQNFWERFSKGQIVDVYDEETFHSWIGRDAFSRALKAWRRIKRDPANAACRAGVSTIANERFLESLADPLSDIDDFVAADRLHVAVQYLPESLIEIGRLHLLGESQVAIGQRLALSIRTVARRLARIRAIWSNREEQG